MRKWLAIGGEGFLGSRLFYELMRRGIEVQATTRRRAPRSVNWLSFDLQSSPVSTLGGAVCPFENLVVCISAGIAGEAACLRNPDLSRYINVIRTLEVARYFHARGAFILFMSSNMVFDGSKPFFEITDNTCATGEYGRQKVEAERGLMDLGDRVAILRMSKLVHRMQEPWEAWLSKLDRTERLEAFSDLWLTPVPVDIAVRLIEMIGDRGSSGIFHLSGSSDVSYFEMATLIARKIGAYEDLVTPARRADKSEAVSAVLSYNTLDMTNTMTIFGIRPPTIMEVVDYLCVGRGAMNRP